MGPLLRRVAAHLTGGDLSSIPLDLYQRYADEIMLITEKEMEKAIHLLFTQHLLVVEGSGAFSIGGACPCKEQSGQCIQILG